MSAEHGCLPLFRWALEQEAARPKATVVDLAAFREASARWRLKLLPNEIPADLAFDRCAGLAPLPDVLPFERRRA